MRRASIPARVRTRSFGFFIGRGRQQRMDAADQHNEIELTFVSRGKLTFRHGPDLRVIPAGNAVLYWAAVPHQVTTVAASTDILWLSLPLSWLLSWNLTPAFTRRLLQGEMLWLLQDAPGQLAQLPLASWVCDFESGSLELRKVVELELEAFFRRLALRYRASKKKILSRKIASRNSENYRGVQHMVRFITEHATEPLTITQIADEAGLSSEYAMRLFRRHWGMTVWTFVLQQRISHAKRLLVLGDAKIADIAFQCGFGSVGRFYAAFTRHATCSPQAFRRRFLPA